MKIEKVVNRVQLVGGQSPTRMCPTWAHLFFVAFCQNLCYSDNRKELSFSAAERWRLALLTEGGFLPSDLRKGGLPNGHIQ